MPHFYHNVCLSSRIIGKMSSGVQGNLTGTRFHNILQVIIFATASSEYPSLKNSGRRFLCDCKTFFSLKSSTAVKIQNGHSTIHAHQYRTACLTGPKKRFNDIFFWLNSIFFYYAMFSELRQKKITFFMLVRNQGSLTP